MLCSPACIITTHRNKSPTGRPAANQSPREGPLDEEQKDRSNGKKKKEQKRGRREMHACMPVKAALPAARAGAGYRCLAPNQSWRFDSMGRAGQGPGEAFSSAAPVHLCSVRMLFPPPLRVTQARHTGCSFSFLAAKASRCPLALDAHLISERVCAFICQAIYC